MSAFAMEIVQQGVGPALDPPAETTQAINDNGCCEAGGDCSCREGCSDGGICEWLFECICG